jgi:hypothetical protein
VDLGLLILEAGHRHHVLQAKLGYQLNVGSALSLGGFEERVGRRLRYCDDQKCNSLQHGEHQWIVPWSIRHNVLSHLSRARDRLHMVEGGSA